MILYEKDGIIVKDEAGVRHLMVDGFCQGRSRATKANDPVSEYMKEIIKYIKDNPVKSLLVIGGGAFLIPSALHSTVETIDVVEPEEQIVMIANRFFMAQTERFDLWMRTGQEAIDHVGLYDAIILDAFNAGLSVAGCYEPVFLEKAKTHLNPGGVLISNQIVDNKNVIKYDYK